ncbi:MAG: deoxyhypusine synthase [Candidatus Diapherotrites archaeon]|nr:deoxyhypusine synthase [Candidatus Diapherotrites archaeon]
MEFIKDFRWKPNMKISEAVKQFSALGFQSIELAKASDIIYKMKKENAKIFLTFPSNLTTSGLRGFFAQLVELGMVDIIVTTAGSIEEDIMKAIGEKFIISRFDADDVALHERGNNRVGNILITNDSYARFEGFIIKLLKKICKEKGKSCFSTAELLHEIGKKLNDRNSILYQAAKHNVKIFCPAIADASLGFQLFMLRDYVKNFQIDVIKDFEEINFETSQEQRKGIIALGGGVSKHYAILSTVLSGGMDYAIYITTSRQYSGSLSGATTSEAKSWGKIKDDSDSVTVYGDATILFPIAMANALDRLYKEKIIRFRK